MLDVAGKMSAPTSLAMAKEQQQGNTANTSIELCAKQQARSKDSELIDCKFDELAKKILNELKQAQYSKDFFQAIDDIIKEPVASKLTHSNKHYDSVNQKHRQTGTNGHPARPPSVEQPRSLPVDVAQSVSRQRQSPSQRQKSAIPTSSIQNGYNQYFSNSKGASSVDQQRQQQQAYPDGKSAASGGEALKRQQSFQGNKASNSNNASELAFNVNQQTQTSNGARRAKSYSTSNALASNMSRYVVDEDDDEVEIIDRDDESYDSVSPDPPITSNNNNRRSFVVNQRFNPITKSKTLSDTTNISEMNSLTKYQQSKPIKQSAQLLQQQQQLLKPVHQNKNRPGFNPIVRSNTIGSNRAGVGSRKSMYADSSEPKSMILTSKDIGSLYKPHMNYTTSVLGNHRLSDDDEIIIIPTQSPSLVSTSPDGEANLDELIERFSISRTKSFWEKLSKGNHSKRSAVTADVAPANDNGKTAHQAGNKVIGVRANGHSNTLDRMDSTGGSNSNYSCSSSGDENGVGGCGSSHSQQDPTLSQLQEMSRQNRFRQTR